MLWLLIIEQQIYMYILIWKRWVSKELAQADTTTFSLCFDLAHGEYMMTSSNGNIFRGYWPFVWGIHRSRVDSHHKGQWRDDVFDLRLNKRLCIQWRHQWFQTSLRFLPLSHLQCCVHIHQPKKYESPFFISLIMAFTGSFQARFNSHRFWSNIGTLFPVGFFDWAPYYMFTSWCQFTKINKDYSRSLHSS